MKKEDDAKMLQDKLRLPGLAKLLMKEENEDMFEELYDQVGDVSYDMDIEDKKKRQKNYDKRLKEVRVEFMNGAWKEHLEGKYNARAPKWKSDISRTKAKVAKLEELHDNMEATYDKYDYTIKALHQFYIE